MLTVQNSAQEVWEDLKSRFDKVDGSITFNLHKEIATLVQGTSSVAAYFTRLKELWVELKAFVPPPGCNFEKSREFLIYPQRQNLYQFLIGLNDNYLQARSQILLMIPLPLVTQAYAMIISDESQKSLATSSAGLLGDVLSGSSSSGHDPTALYLKVITQNFKKIFNMFCEFCKIKGYTKDVGYKLVGYPQDSTFKKKGRSQWILWLQV